MATRTVPQRLFLAHAPCRFLAVRRICSNFSATHAHTRAGCTTPTVMSSRWRMAMLLQRYRLAVVPNARIEPKGSNLDPAHGMPMRIIPQDRRFERVPVRGSIHRLVEFV